MLQNTWIDAKTNAVRGLPSIEPEPAMSWPSSGSSSPTSSSSSNYRGGYASYASGSVTIKNTPMSEKSEATLVAQSSSAVIFSEAICRPGDSSDLSNCSEKEQRPALPSARSDYSMGIPDLDLMSMEDDVSSRANATFSVWNSEKIVRQPNLAFENWLSAKRKLKQDEAARRKKEEEKKKKEMEERKRLAKEKYEKWCEQKMLEEKTKKKKKPVEQKKEPTEEEAKANRLAEWERAKREENDRRRAQKLEEEKKKREEEEQRRQKSVDAWEKWVANASTKPKPVPLNQGIATLRGTVSDIYINPNKWQGIIPEEDENN